MKMKLALLSAVLAIPFTDTHSTQVQVVPLAPTDSNSQFLVQITRFDELKDNDDLKAVKSQVFLLALQVGLKDNTLVLNDQPVDMGVQRLRMEASTMVETVNNFSKDEALKNLDTGIVDIEIQAKGKEVVHEGVVIREIILAEKVMAIDGNKVEQEEIVQQVVQIFPDGRVSCHQANKPPVKAHHRSQGVHHNRNHHERKRVKPAQKLITENKSICSGKRVGFFVAFGGIALASFFGLYFVFKSILGFFTPHYEAVPVDDEKDMKKEFNEELPPYDPEFKA